MTPRGHVATCPRGRAVVQSSTCSDRLRASSTSIPWFATGFYANRADFIRTAIRNQLERQDDAIRQSVARRQLKLGLSHYTRQDLEAARDSGTPLHIQILGLASIASDVTPELARAAIASVQVLGAFQASPTVKAALADRTA
jgi:Arc/MetJ-type ribon-helix-helix transcriptional regulator